MAPFKGKPNAGQIKAVESREPSKSVSVSKFKIYSENERVSGRRLDKSGASSLQGSMLSKRQTLLENKTASKDLTCNAEESRCCHETHDKMKVGRKALADVSNLRGNSCKFDKSGVSRKLMTSGTLTFSRPPAEKEKTNISHGATTSQASVTASTKDIRTSSNFHRVQTRGTVENKQRQISNNKYTITRKSLPVLRRASELGMNKVQGDVRSSEKATRKPGFPLKNRVSGKVVPQASNVKGKVLKDRMSGIVTAPRNQTSKDVPLKLRKSIKPVVRTTLQMSNSQNNSKSKSFSSLDKPLVTISTRVKEGAESSIPKIINSKESHGEVSEGGLLEITADKRSHRRKSYTSLLISRPKLLEKNKVLEQEMLPNIDDQGNPLEAADYVDDIYQYYWIMEAQSASPENYMMNQTDLTPKMRGILINWLIEVHFKFDLMPETLYLTVALLDRYLSQVSIKKKEVQLVGLTSLLLASKYEDFWYPRVKDLISISAESYTRKEMLEMEKQILKKLKFRLNLPTAYVFMLRFLKASQSDEQLERLAFYFIELCLVDYEALKFRSSLLCASAVYVARCTLKKVPAWTPLLSKHARYEESQIRDCAEMILRLHKGASNGVLKVTYDKYMRPEFGRVAAIKPLGSLPL